MVSDIDECSSVVGDMIVFLEKTDVENHAEKPQLISDDEIVVEEFKRLVVDFICKKDEWDAMVYQMPNLYIKDEV